jgi:hypothetical protein
MVLCNIVWACDLPSIWQHFAASKVKQVKIHCHQLQKHMEEWGHDCRTEIDTIFFEQKTIEDIINLRFNPGEGLFCCRTSQVAQFLITILPSKTPHGNHTAAYVGI